MPAARALLSFVWSGNEMIVWGGQDISNVLHNDGGRYDPMTDSWLPTTTNDVPAARSMAVAVWIGDAMLGFGGWTGDSFYVNDLWSYQPSNVLSGDGLADEWQQKYFGTTWTEDAFLDSDPDRDGQPNHYEFTTGTDPTNSLSRFVVTAGREDSHLQLKLSGLSLDRRFAVRWTTNITAPVFHSLNSFEVRTQSQSIVVTDLDAISGTRFYKVEVMR
jgi:hypothetical protein